MLMDLTTFATETRRLSLAAIFGAGSGHPGGSLSAADLLAYLYLRVLGTGADARDRADRDRFVLSKGHACPALYAAAAVAGWIDRAAIPTLRQLGSTLQGHPHAKDMPWLETSTGSLGQGFSAALGIALGLRMQKSRARVYVMLGDGELQEGEVWEAAMCASHYGLDNLCAIVDYNKMQSDDTNANVMSLEPLGAKWDAFNWGVIEIDGHDFQDIESALRRARGTKGRPTVIIAHTAKGRGVSFMEGSPAWHGSVLLREDEFATALRDLGTSESDILRYVDGTIWHHNG
jgi:transketolase